MNSAPGNPLAHLNKRPRVPLSTKRFRLPNGVLLPTELEVARDLHAKGEPGLTLAQFVAAAWPVVEPATQLQWNWHLDVMCEHLQALVSGTPGPDGRPCPQNLLINVPPGTMKSLCFSVFLPAWVWLWLPSWRSIYASGTPAVVTRDSLKCRNLIKSDWYQKTFEPKWRIASDQDEKQHFANSAGGFRQGMAAGASVTGVRADFLGTDDPNDAKEIQSKAHRNQINVNWWSDSWHNRIADPSKSKRAIIMQRLHEEDLAGYVLEKEKGEWAHLSIPMEFEKERPGDQPTWLGWTDPRTEEGQVLADRFTPAFLEGERKTLGSAGYAGQMQQRPVNAAGNRFQRTWWRFWSPNGLPAPRPQGCADVPPIKFDPTTDRGTCDEVICSWDLAFKDGDQNDWGVGIVVMRRGAQRIVVERYRKKAAFPEAERAIRQQHADWRPDAVLVEEAANGAAVVQTLAAEVPGLLPVKPLGGKEARAAVLEPKVEAGNWYLPEGAPWLDEWVAEFAAFPLGKHDDQVDSASQAEARFLEDPDVVNARLLLGLT